MMNERTLSSDKPLQTDAGENRKRWIIGMTGASGAVYGVRLCKHLLDHTDVDIKLIITDAAWRVLQEELDWEPGHRADVIRRYFGSHSERLEYLPIKNIGANVASGTFRTEGMVVVPCSMGTLAGIACGMSDNLLKRTADVMLKEKRKLILVPRETPLNSIHLDNMLKLANMGATLLPAMPAYYHRPQTMDELIDFLVGKILDSMEIHHQLFRRWGED